MKPVKNVLLNFSIEKCRAGVVLPVQLVDRDEM